MEKNYKQIYFLKLESGVSAISTVNSLKTMMKNNFSIEFFFNQ